jgi:predicted enzyme related to lactoylglutathione lyase
MNTNAIVHVEFSANDPEKSAQFYKSVFEWKITRFPGMDYISFNSESGPAGGFPKTTGRVKQGDVFVYIEVDSIEATLAKVESMGGKTWIPKYTIPGVGDMAFFLDPSGNKVALMKSAEQKISRE